MEKELTLRASDLPRIMTCPGSLTLPEAADGGSDAARLGTAAATGGCELSERTPVTTPIARRVAFLCAAQMATYNSRLMVR